MDRVDHRGDATGRETPLAGRTPAAWRNAARRLRRAGEALAFGALDLLYPPHCLACGDPLPPSPGPRLCARCRAEVKWVGAACAACGTPRPPFAGKADRCDSCRGRALHFRRARGAVLYEGPVRKLLHRLKFENLALAAEPLAGFAVEALRRDPWGFAAGAQAVVPVPVHWTRRRRRGFNQSELLARRIARALRLPCVAALKKTRATEAQVDLPRERRLENPRGAFRARRIARIRGRTVLLVDDVMTTASTAAECSRVLLEAGAREVLAFAVARQA